MTLKTLPSVCHTFVSRVADMRLMPFDGNYTHACAVCGERVGLYPIDEMVRRQRPHIRLVCLHCVDRVEEVLLFPLLDREPSE